MDINLTGKTAVVTGGGRGLGKRIALELARAGADVWVEDILGDLAKETSAEIAALGRKSGYLAGSVVDEGHTAGLIQAAYDATGRFDIMVNNAGIVRLGTFMDFKTEHLHELLDVNLFGVVHGTRNALKKLEETNTRGRIINVSSIAGRTNSGNPFSYYCVSKAAVISFTQAAAKYAAKNGSGTTVNAICPGIIRTEMWEDILDYMVSGSHGISESERAATKEQRDQTYAGCINSIIPQKVEQEDIDIAWLALYFCSEGGRYVTGQAVNVDGGSVMS